MDPRIHVVPISGGIDRNQRVFFRAFGRQSGPPFLRSPILHRELTSSVFDCILVKPGTDVLQWTVDVQDTFFDTDRKSVAMVTAYYGKDGGKSGPSLKYFLSECPHFS